MTHTILYCTYVYTVSPVEKLTKRTEPEAHHERTSTVLGPYQERTSTARSHLDRTTSVPRPHHKRTSTAPRGYLDRTSSVPRPHHERTSTAPAYSTSTAPRVYALTILVQYLDRTASVRVDYTAQELTEPCHERIRVTAYLDEPS